MQLTPRYEGPPALRLDFPVGTAGAALVRQRARLGELLASLDDGQWAAPSRCDGWSVQDVIAHLNGTNQFWSISIAAGLAGAPTRYLTSFDPVTTPAQMVDAVRELSPAQVLEQYVSTCDELAGVVQGLDEVAWATRAESPPGHVAVHAVVLHALWDAWIHERDVALPLGLDPAVDADEVAHCLRYVAALGPAFLATAGSTRSGLLAVTATDPEVDFVVELGETVVVRDAGPTAGGDGARLKGDAVELVESLSFRAPLVHDLVEADRWLLGGLGAVFDVSPLPA